MSTARLLCGMLKRIQNGKAWHGPALAELLDTVTPEEAAANPVPGGHCIWTLVRHIAAWRRQVLGALQGKAMGELAPEVDFPPVTDVSQQAWDAAKQENIQSAEELLAALAEMTDEQLAESSPGQKFPLAGSVHVVLQHDTYHMGQIALLKKLVRENAAATAGS